MIRMSALRNRPVVLLNRQIGYFQSLFLDQAQKRVRALIVSRGIKGKCAVLPEQVSHVSDCCIQIDGFEKYQGIDECLLCRFAVDTTGSLVGKVMDYAIDPVSMDVCAVEIMPGYLPPESGIRIWVYDYRKTENAAQTITIPAISGYEPTLLWEGI